MTSVYDPMTGLALECSVVDNSMAHETDKVSFSKRQGVWQAAQKAACHLKERNKHNKARLAMQVGINALLQEDVAAEVLQHFSTRKRLQLASVCRVWRASVAKSWSNFEVSGPIDVQEKQLAWMAQHVPPRMLKVRAWSARDHGATGSHRECASWAVYACRYWRCAEAMQEAKCWWTWRPA